MNFSNNKKSLAQMVSHISLMSCTIDSVKHGVKTCDVHVKICDVHKSVVKVFLYNCLTGLCFQTAASTSKSNDCIYCVLFV